MSNENVRVFENQLLASTAKPVGGLPAIPREALKMLADQSGSCFPLHQRHDIAQPVVGTIRNIRFLETERGEAEIRGDLVVPENVDLTELRGISPTFTGPPAYGHPKERRLVAEIALDRRIFSEEDLRSAVAVDYEGHGIRAKSLYRYSVRDTVVTIIVLYPVLQLLHGFLNAAGADIYKSLKTALIRLASKVKERGHVVAFDMTVNVSIAGNEVELVVRVFEELMHDNARNNIDVNAIVNQLQTDFAKIPPRRIVVIAQPELPYYKISSVN